MSRTKIPDKLLKDWNQHIKWLSEVAVEKENPLTKKERIDLALQDYQYFVKTYFNHYVTYKGIFVPNNLVQNDIAYKLASDDNCFIGAKWSRGFGKSSHCSLFIPIWLFLKRKTNHILIVSKNLESASKLLSHVQAELEYNQQLIKDFSIDGKGFKTMGDWSKQSIVINGYSTAINCAGRGQDIRGLRHGSSRPQTIILDDLDDSTIVQNPERVNEAFDWLKESVLGALDIKDFKVIYVENLYAKNSIFAKYLAEIPDLYISEINALTDTGQSSWPARFSTKDLMFIKQQIGSISFSREYMNQPIVTGSVFKPEYFKIAPIKITNEDLIVMYADLSFSDKGDYKAVSVMTKRKNDFFLIDLYGRKGSVDSVFYWMYDVYDKYHKMGCPVYLYVEGNFGQDIIYSNMETVSVQKGYRLPIIYDKSVKANKYNRIELSSCWFERGLFYTADYLENTPDYRNMLDQYLGFGEGSRKNDDIPDSIASNIEFLNKNTRSAVTEPMFEIDEENIKY